MHVSQLFIYPVKSCAGIEQSQLEFDALGPKFDRRWMFVDVNGEFVTQREHPMMALIQPRVSERGLVLSVRGYSDYYIPYDAGAERRAREGRRVRVWKDFVDAEDEGDGVAEWASTLLKMNVRLVNCGRAFERKIDTRFAHHGEVTGFADGFPVLIVSQGALDELNERLLQRGQTAVSMNRFRPNIVIDDCDAFAEDYWKLLRVGTMTFDVVKPCARCSIVAVDPRTGERSVHSEPLATLNTFRKRNGQVYFGQNAIHQGAEGTLHLGDSAECLAAIH